MDDTINGFMIGLIKLALVISTMLLILTVLIIGLSILTFLSKMIVSFVVKKGRLIIAGLTRFRSKL